MGWGGVGRNNEMAVIRKGKGKEMRRNGKEKKGEPAPEAYPDCVHPTLGYGVR